MKTRPLFCMNRLMPIVLLVALIVSLAQVRPAYATSIVVNTSADNYANDGKCTLREALDAANLNVRSGPASGECAAGSPTGVDTISFNPSYAPYIITVGSGGTIPQQLPYIITSIVITGLGTTSTIIQAASTPNTANWRVFQVTPNGNLTLDGVTVRHGRCTGLCTAYNNSADSNSGGGIFNAGTLTVTNSIISGNTADAGGGIVNLKTLTVTNSVISGNNASGENGLGGGIYSDDILTITNSTISGNTAIYGGGGIFTSWIANVRNSTITGNIASDLDGGGIHNVGLLNLTNSTITGNEAVFGNGGGIFNQSDNLTVRNSTIAGNNSTSGDGIYTGDNTGLLLNTIVANNSGGNCSGMIINGGNNLDSGSSCGWGSNNGSMSNINPLLGPLANNGGPTKTMRLLATSPAIDAGYPTVCSNAPVNGVDQRGVTRPLGTGCDIGAYESMNGPGPDTTGVFRPSNGALYLKHVNLTGFADVAINYGQGGDYPVVGDWDGDGDATIGVYRNGTFLLRNSNTIGFADLAFPFGAPGDQPVAGDWNGDGVDTIGVYRSSTFTFYLRNSNAAGSPDYIFSLGIPGDVGIAGDWNGDGKDTTGVFRPSNGALYLKNTNQTGFADIAINYGQGGDKPVTGDWNADGIDTIGVYRNGTFLLRNSNTIGFAEIQFGLGVPGDRPIAGNWDGVP